MVRMNIKFKGVPRGDERAEFGRFLAAKGLKMTKQRALIFELFLKREGHLSSEELYGLVKKKDPSIGRATVYRALKLFKEADLAREVDFGEGLARYEHSSGPHHDHLICVRCGKAIEVVDESIEELQEKLSRRHGFTLTGHKMQLFGVCPACRRDGQRKT
jgi:Fur family ferric uptake transcriptional regulator